MAAEEAAYQAKYGPAGMLEKLRQLHDHYGTVRGSLVECDPSMASLASYHHRFAGLDMAYQRLFDDVRKKATLETMEQLKRRATLEQYGDYVVLSRSLSVLIQPAVPAQFGYDDYWAFRPDPRKEIDITLGVPLISRNGAYEVLGYMVFPRLLTRSRSLRVSARSDGCLSLYGWQSLDLIWSILDGDRRNATVDVRLMEQRSYQMVDVDKIKVINSRERETGPVSGTTSAASRTVGLLVPVVVNGRYLQETGYYELVCGEGRVLAHRKLGQTQIRAEVIDRDRKDGAALLARGERGPRHAGHDVVRAGGQAPA